MLMIWNGPGVRSKWQISDVISQIRKRKGLSDISNNDIDGSSSPLSASISKRARGNV